MNWSRSRGWGAGGESGEMVIITASRAAVKLLEVSIFLK